MNKGMTKWIAVMAMAFVAMVSGSRAATVGLAWDPSPDTNVTYTVVTTGPTGGLTQTSVGTATVASIAGLTAGAAYSFYVIAVNPQGIQSDQSNVVGYTIPADAPPAPVSWYQAIARQGDGSYIATMKWNALAASYAITNYLVLARLDGTTWVTNSVGTNLVGSVHVPVFGSVSLFLQGQSALAFTPVGFQVGYTRPGASKNLRIISVSAQ